MGPEAVLLPIIFGILIGLVLFWTMFRKPLGRWLGMTARKHSHAQQDFVQALKEGLDEEEKSKENHTYD